MAALDADIVVHPRGVSGDAEDCVDGGLESSRVRAAGLESGKNKHSHMERTVQMHTKGGSAEEM